MSDDIEWARGVLEGATIVGHPDYLVTRDGRVLSTVPWRGSPGRELAQQPNSHGYPRVRFSTNGRRVSAPVHRLVAEAFLGPRPSPRHQVRHLDGTRTNNHVVNLRWGTAKENAADREKHGRTCRGERNGYAKLSNSQVVELKRRLANGSSPKIEAARLGVSATTVRQRCPDETRGIHRPRGADVHTARLTEADVRTIRRSSLSARELAEHYGMDRSAIHNVMSGRSWRHVQ